MNGAVNISSHLTERALVAPYQIALHIPAGQTRDGHTRYTHLTYAQLELEVAQLAARFHRDGFRPGTRTAIMVPPSLAFFVLTFAAFRAGLVPVFIDPGMGLRSLKKCLADAAPSMFIAAPKAHLARLLFGWGRSAFKHLLHVGPATFFLGGRRLPLGASEVVATPALPLPPALAEPAAVLFTSGSTGLPKGVIYGHRQFNAQIAAIKSLFAITPGEVDLGTFPLFALFAPALGMTSVVPEMDFTRPAQVIPDKIFRAVEAFGVENMFGSPALMRTLALNGVPRGVRLPSLKRVISTGAAVDPKILRQAVKLLRPGVEIFTPYGATEALPVTCIGSDEILAETAAAAANGQGVCVGRPAPQAQVQIMPISDQAVSEWSPEQALGSGSIGEIVVSGAQVTERYDLSEPTRLAKMRHLQTGATVHRMGDLGYFDARGRLWFCGRKGHRLTLPDRELYTETCEGIFNAQPGVYRTALVGRGERGRMQPVLCVEADLRLSKPDRARLTTQLQAVAQAHALTQPVQELRFYEHLPVDIRHNSKIFRERLKMDVDRP